MGTEIQITSDHQTSGNLAELKAKVSTALLEMVSVTEQLNVKDELSYRTITRIYKEAREWKKVVETARKDLCEPYRDEISRINDTAKQLCDPLDTVIALANMKCASYIKLLAEQKAQEEARLKEAASLFDAEEQVFVVPLEKSLRGDGALTVTKKVKKFKLNDITKVPYKYLQLNEKQIELDIKMGIDQISGIDIYEEEITTLRTR